VSSGSPYLVGERGPELFVPNNSGMIIPHAQTQEMVSGRGDIHLYVLDDASKITKHIRDNPHAHHEILRIVGRNAHRIVRPR
jgi:hypothetical protein